MADSKFDGAFENLGIADEDDDNKLVIGLDFGTTYSGVAYLFTGIEKPESIVITDWPGMPGANKPKVPTLIKYDPPSKPPFRWGSELDKSVDKSIIVGLKLLLDPDHPKPLFIPQMNTKAELQNLGIDAVDVAADYISAIYNHALSKINAAWPEEYIRGLRKRFVLSVPAVWSDKAKSSTMEAAKKAGFFSVDLIKEPEAAALFTLHTLKDKALGIGDAFVLCDAGGGTVDLISYEITKLEPNLELRELVAGTGGMSGSLMLNKRFEEAIKNAVGEEQYFSLKKTESYRLAMSQFDNTVKTAFNPFLQPKDHIDFVNFPMSGLKDDPANNISSNCFSVNREILTQIFEPLIKNISALVREQVQSVRIKRMEEGHKKGKEIKAIFLVGGFGSSTYLKECLQKYHPDVQVIQPTDAWSAIVRGAVLSKAPHEATITSTVATRHYGVKGLHPWRDKDEGQEKHWDCYKSRNLVRKMTWYINTGADLQRTDCISFPFFRTLASDHVETDLIFEDELIQSEAIRAPKYPNSRDTKANCVLQSDLRGLSKDNFRRCTTKDGSPYYEVHYSLKVAFATAMMRFTLEFNGKEMGAVKAKY